jgi:ribonuclease HI
MTDKTKAVFYIDGACEPVNPGGVASWAWVGYWNGVKKRHSYGVIGEGDGMTNNVAEYGALVYAMRHLIAKDFHDEITFRSDSQLVVNQMSGAWAVKSPHIRRAFEEAKELEKNFKKVYYQWVPREQNEEADALSKQAYYEHKSKK